MSNKDVKKITVSYVSPVKEMYDVHINMYNVHVQTENLRILKIWENIRLNARVIGL
mgnify:CR=1 FL=1